ncbi:MAG TPA: bifunctional diaminohydroxyphosphoribosylaminopyrimidine deaminase/5-amino-6-(5-phosphoribosylamino)uracil reductase RibD [Gemmatimonadaceae bacterium]|nr:bifunctional diaminohydroxyphosphoribosylaminopyrimidine deaminase/5-amino-6-(5-phosphoribosylamino)uracil reductase RibD [Gemmatimonadaceae bacterium]
MNTRDDSAHMRRALDLARRGWGQVAPNPMVGAVLVRDGQVVAEGFHARYGEAHAEAAALAVAGDAARGATLYATLEPCTHQGRTPPCADAIVAAGVRRVVIAVRDPNPVAAGGVARLRAAGIAVDVGEGEADARELNAAFFHRFAHPERPFVTLKLATSADGAIAGADRAVRARLTGEAADRDVHHLRAGVDAIAVGIGTVLADDPRLTVRLVEAPRVAPTRVVFDSALRLPPDSLLARTAREVPVLLVAGEPDVERARRLERLGVTILSARTLPDALRALARAGFTSLLVEGGARLAGSFLTGALVDRLVIFRAPVVLGAGALDAFAHIPRGDAERLRQLPVLERRVLGDDIVTTYSLGAT